MARDRQSNFEALRLFGMIIIVSQHYAGYTQWDFDRSSHDYIWFNEYLMNCMGTTGKIGVDIFLLMTGYFLNGKGLKASTIARTWFQTINWSYVFLALTLLNTKIDGWKLKLALSPILAHQYWFVSAYVTSALCTGWIAAIAKHATPSQYMIGLISLFFLMAVFDWPKEICFCNTQWFIFVIALGAFLRRFSVLFTVIRTRTIAIGLAIISLINFGSVYIFTFHEIKWAIEHKGPAALSNENWCILPLIYAILLVILVQRWSFSSEIINKLAGCTLGVYLIHENIFVHTPLWTQWVKGSIFKNTIFLPVIAVVQIAIVYLICTGMEYCRQSVVGTLEERVCNYIGARLDGLADRINSLFTDEKHPV